MICTMTTGLTQVKFHLKNISDFCEVLVVLAKKFKEQINFDSFLNYKICTAMLRKYIY